jgi:hypothetical protein
MRLAQTTEWMLVAGLIVYTVFLPGLPAVRRVVGSPLGTAGSLLGVYLLAKKVSVPLALVALVAVARSSSSVLREHATNSMGDCHCTKLGFTYDKTAQKCTKAGETTTYEPVCCADTQIWNDRTEKCTVRPGPEGALTGPLLMDPPDAMKASA